VPPQTLSGQHIPHNGRQYSACGHPARTSRASSVLVAKVYILGPPSFSAYALAQLHFTASRNSKVLAFNGHLDSPGLGPHESGVLSTGWCHDTSQLVLLHFSSLRGYQAFLIASLTPCVDAGPYRFFLYRLIITIMTSYHAPLRCATARHGRTPSIQ
jgi:hypothetical protein